MSKLRTLQKMLEDSLMSDLDWRCVESENPEAGTAGFDDSAWTGQKGLMGRGWKAAWFRSSFVTPRLLDGCALEVRPCMGGETQIYINGRLANVCGPDGSASTPVLRAGERVVVAIRSEDGWLSYENPSPAALFCDRQRKLRAIYEELFFIRRLGEFDGSVAGQVESCLTHFMDLVDEEALSSGDVERYVKSLTSAEKALGGADQLLKQYSIYVVPHSHVDLAWGWTYDETKRIMRTVFDRATDLMDRYPDYTFAQDQPPTYTHLEGTHLMDKMARYISQGRLEVCGALYSEPEGNMPGGESFIRQVMMTKRYFSNRFGVDPLGCWNLDSFSGHCWSLPQILKKSGVSYYTFANWSNLIPDVEFWWEGPDGSRVLAYHLPCHYDSAQMMEHKKILNNLFVYASRSKFKRFMFLDGDDLTPPLEASIEGVKWFNGLTAAPSVRFSTSARFFEDLERDGLKEIPAFRGELSQPLDPQGDNNVGSYSTHSEVKRRNRLCENLLLTAEKFGSIAMLLGLKFPREAIARAWRNVLLNQMHDILPGTAIKEAYEEAHCAYDEAEALAGETISLSMGRISSRVDTRAEGVPILVFNPLSWERTELAQVRVTLDHSYDAWPRIRDAEGKDVECQVVSDSRGTYDKTNRALSLLFLAEKIPSLGYKVYHLDLGGKAPEVVDEARQQGVIVMQNNYLKAEIDAGTGLLRSLKAHGHEFISQTGEGLLIQKYEDKGDPWHINISGEPVNLSSAESVEVTETGPLRKTVRVRRKHGRSEVIQEISVIKGIPRLICRVTIDCNDIHVLFKAGIPVNIGPAEATFEIPFASIVREANVDRPAQNWVDLSDGETGLALLNDGRYGYDVEGGNCVRLTLLRNPKSHHSTEGTDSGFHSTSLGIFPHLCDWRSGAVRQGMEFNNPLLCHVDSVHEGDLPASFSFISLSAPNGVISCLKPHEDSGDLVLRIYEAHGERIEGAGLESQIEWKDMEEIDMVERGKMDSSSGPTSLSPYEIKTFRLKAPRLRTGPL